MMDDQIMEQTIATDVIIVGGGLGGLSLALQLIESDPTLKIAIVEKNVFPVPDTTAKVGESSVEIGAHYFSEVLGLKSHFETRHLRKHGLRCFFGENIVDMSDYDELGVSELFGIPTYQIERGVLENHMHSLLIKSGVACIDGAEILQVNIGRNDHSIVCQSDGRRTKIQGRWVVDAAGRRSLLKTYLGLAKSSDHSGHAVFFRVDKTISIDDWSGDHAWRARIKDPSTRWLSTNHLMGPGYWIWIIPLGSGATSFGIVMDDEAFTESGIETFEDTIDWIRPRHPLCAEAIQDANLLDFKFVNNYSYACGQVFSHEGWGLIGEAGVFADPFYSPGSDFIAIGNTFLTELIVSENCGKDITIQSLVYQKIFDSFFNNTLSIYRSQYGGFGDREMMSLKLVWDYTYYWGVLSALFFSGVITDIKAMQKLNPTLMTALRLNNQMQSVFVERAKRRQVLPAKRKFMDQYLVSGLREINTMLKDDSFDLDEVLLKAIEKMQVMLPKFTAILEGEERHGKNLFDSLDDYCASLIA